MMTLLALLAAFALASDGSASAPAPVADDSISILTEIDEDVANAVDARVAQLKEAGAKHLTIYIDSPGGQIGAGLSIIDSLRDSGIPTTCIVNDRAISMAAIILESSACGERVVHAHSVVMFHGVSGKIEGTQREHENGVVAMRAINKMAAEIVCARIGMPVEMYMKLVVDEGRELWWVGEENLFWKAADRVIPPPAPTK